MDLSTGSTAFMRAPSLPGVKKATLTGVSTQFSSMVNTTGALTPTVALIASQLGYLIGICAKGGVATPTICSTLHPELFTRADASTVAKSACSGTAAVPDME